MRAILQRPHTLKLIRCLYLSEVLRHTIIINTKDLVTLELAQECLLDG